MTKKRKYLFYLALVMNIASACSGEKKISLEPAGYEQVQTITIEKGDLKAVFIDNSELKPDHRAGYNGIAELYHIDQDSTVFVPAYAGFNLEHVFSGDSLVQFFEPRVNPMMLYKKNDSEVFLYQKATPVSGAESLTEFKLVAPYYIDVTFSCILHNEEYFRHNYAGFFWASYINKPPDMKIRFPGTEAGGNEKWITAFSEKHGTKSTHRHADDDFDFYFADNFTATLPKNYSDYRFTLPFYFGRFHNMSLAWLFDSSEVIRFTQSPSGGGNGNPAWDFQYLIPEPETHKIYSFRARMIYKPFISNEDIKLEYEKWIGN
jgi:hypothetical protein